MSSKLERLVFSGRKDDFLNLAEQFEARMHSLKLVKILSGEATYLDYMQIVRNNSSTQASYRKRAGSIRREEEDFVVRFSSGFRQNIIFLDDISVMALELRAYCVNASKFRETLAT